MDSLEELAAAAEGRARNTSPSTTVRKLLTPLPPGPASPPIPRAPYVTWTAMDAFRFGFFAWFGFAVAALVCAAIPMLVLFLMGILTLASK